MAQLRGAADPAPQASNAPLPPPRSSRADTGSLGRYRGAVSTSREAPFQGLLTLPGAGSGRRRAARRELLGLQGAAPAGQPSEERAEEPTPSGPGGSGLCLEPREHMWILATAEGRFEVLRELLEAEPGLLLRGDPITGYGVLHWLAKHGRHEELILVHDFARRQGLPLDVSSAGSGGLTPLHLAALQGHDLVIKVLVGALGADPTRRDHSGRRAYQYLRPDAAQSLRELSGAEDWEPARGSDRHNINNNSSCAAAWPGRRTRNTVGASAVETSDRATTPLARMKDATGSRVAQIHGLLRHLFPFQDRRGRQKLES